MLTNRLARDGAPRTARWAGAAGVRRRLRGHRVWQGCAGYFSERAVCGEGGECARAARLVTRGAATCGRPVAPLPARGVRVLRPRGHRIRALRVQRLQCSCGRAQSGARRSRMRAWPGRARYADDGARLGCRRGPRGPREAWLRRAAAAERRKSIVPPRVAGSACAVCCAGVRVRAAPLIYCIALVASRYFAFGVCFLFVDRLMSSRNSVSSLTTLSCTAIRTIKAWPAAGPRHTCQHSSRPAAREGGRDLRARTSPLADTQAGGQTIN